MPHAEYNDFLGQHDPREHRASHMSRINVTRVWYKARPYRNGWPARTGTGVFMNERREVRRMGGVEASGNRRQAKHVAAPRIK